MAKGGFFPPKNFEEGITDYVTLLRDNTKPWFGKVPGNAPDELGALERKLNEYVPLRQRFEQARLAYEEAKGKYVDAGGALWTDFYSALSYARTFSKKDAVLAKGLDKYKRGFTKRTPPKTPT